MLDFDTTHVGMLTVLILPGIAAVMSARRGRAKTYLVALAFPLVWCLNLAFVAPAHDFRYVAPAAIWGVLTSLVATTDALRLGSIRRRDEAMATT
jgi:hypothetical protein